MRVRRAMRCTWVSAGTTWASKREAHDAGGRLRAHARRARSGRPSPRRAARRRATRGRTPRGSAAIASSAAWIRGAFWLARPATRTASSTSATGAARTSSQVGSRARRAANARSWLTSVVLWLSSVVTSSLTGSWRRAPRERPVRLGQRGRRSPACGRGCRGGGSPSAEGSRRHAPMTRAGRPGDAAGDGRRRGSIHHRPRRQDERPFTIVHRDDLERTGAWSLVRRSLGLTSFGMNLVEIAPGTAIPEHDETASDQEEVFVVLSGAPIMVIDGVDHPAPAGTFVRLDPAPAAHGPQRRRRDGRRPDRLGPPHQRLRADGVGVSAAAVAAAPSAAHRQRAEVAGYRSLWRAAPAGAGGPPRPQRPRRRRAASAPAAPPSPARTVLNHAVGHRGGRAGHGRTTSTRWSASTRTSASAHRRRRRRGGGPRRRLRAAAFTAAPPLDDLPPRGRRRSPRRPPRA